MGDLVVMTGLEVAMGVYDGGWGLLLLPRGWTAQHGGICNLGSSLERGDAGAPIPLYGSL